MEELGWFGALSDYAVMIALFQQMDNRFCCA